MFQKDEVGQVQINEVPEPSLDVLTSIDTTLKEIKAIMRENADNASESLRLTKQAMKKIK